MRNIRMFATVPVAVALCAVSAQAQQRRITGRVAAQSGEPLQAAAVSVVGTTTGTYTAENGTFSLLIPQAGATLRVRRIGYRQATVPVTAGQEEVNITLEKDVLQLETQVVTGQATSVSSRNAANAVTVVNTDQLNRAPAQAIDQALQGKVAGAVITQNSGAPGGGTQIQLRGVTSINASSSPLYVVDGVIVNNSSISNGLNAISGAAGGNLASNQDQQVNRIADLNPADIENIEVLKGASAGAIYGSSGSNGVIIITTKRGQAGKPVVGYTQRFGTQTQAKKLGSRCFGSANEVYDFFGDSAIVAMYNAAPVKCQDYEKQLYGEHSLSYESDLSVRGGTNTGTTYYFSGTAKHDGGIQQNTQYNKQSLRANIGQTVGSKLAFHVNSELLHTLTERGLSGNDNNGVAPYTIISATPSFFDFRPKNGVYPFNPFLGVGSNLLQDAALIRTPENVYRLIGSASADYTIFAKDKQTLTLNVLGGIDSYADQGKLYSPPELYFEPLDDNLPGTVFNVQGNFVNANVNGTLVHKYTTNPFTATTSGGLRKVRRNSQVQTITGRGLPPGMTDVSSALQTFTNESQTANKDFSYFLQEEFLTLSEHLNLTAAVNSERSSVNGDDKKFYSYPKFSASYDMPYLPRYTDNLKFRVAYGRAGNLPPYGNKFTSLITSTDDNVIGGRPSTVLGLSDIHPETSTEIEGGFDWAFFHSRAQLSVTQYRKQVDDLILGAAMAPSTGFSTKIIQSGNQLVNHGTEISLQLNPVHTGFFNWVSNTTYAHERGKITQLAVPAFTPGGAFSTSYGTGRIELGKSPTQVYVQVGCNVPLTASGRCTSKKYGTHGDFMPDYQMGFSNDFDFGPVRLSSLLDWRKGGTVINLTNNYFDGGLLADTAEGNARLRRFRTGQPVYAENGTFVKLRELALSYGLPKNVSQMLSRGTATDLRLELSGRNLYTWTKYTGLDPEVSNFGSQNIRQNQDVTPFPPSRQFFVSLISSF